MHHHCLGRISIATSPDRRQLFHDVPLSMRFGLTRDLPLKRSFAHCSVGSREHLPKSTVTMATKSENLITEETNKKKEEVSLPPPPEKPEPGDCCGSGCVRCVWDVYYEQLEEYNKLLLTPKSGSGDDDKPN